MSNHSGDGNDEIVIGEPSFDLQGLISFYDTATGEVAYGSIVFRLGLEDPALIVTGTGGDDPPCRGIPLTPHMRDTVNTLVDAVREVSPVRS